MQTQTLTLFTKINSQCVININVKGKNIKLLEDSIGENLGDLGLGTEFLATTPKKHNPWTKKKGKFNFIKFKTLLSEQHS